MRQKRLFQCFVFLSIFLVSFGAIAAENNHSFTNQVYLPLLLQSKIGEYYCFSLQPTVAYTDEDIVTLTEYPCWIWWQTPTYRHVTWYDSQGNIAVACEQTVLTPCTYAKWGFREVEWVAYYFYIKDLNRKPDVYTVFVCPTSSCESIIFAETFEIKNREISIP